jgi:hypothetical protein
MLVHESSWLGSAAVRCLVKPRLSHRAQIEKIVVRLGPAADGHVAKLWIALNDAYGRVHERSFHESLKVDDAFRTGPSHMDGAAKLRRTGPASLHVCQTC